MVYKGSPAGHRVPQAGGSFPEGIRKMNSLLVCVVLLAWGLSPAGGSLWELQKMITEATGKKSWLHYSSYGCYCGLGGKGNPKDATDRCCQVHDACYGSLSEYHCDAKKQHYSYSWLGNSLTCRNDLRCAQNSCECDRSLALCLKRNVWSYSKRYLFYPKHRCR